jgi:hypothetical protein
MKTLIFFIGLCAAVGVAVGQTTFAVPQANYKTYTNARFKYSISYPADLLIPQGEAENGDGQVFKEKGNTSVEMRVWGGYNVMNETLRGKFAELTRKWGKGVTYKVIRQDWFVVSALVNGKIHYQKTIWRGDTFKTFQIEYDAVRGSTYNDVTDRISKSFKG